jgi:hypothetical protein
LGGAGLLVKALRKRWSEVKIILRADSGFCRWKMLRWCERVGVNYIVGLAKNERLNTLSAKVQKRAERKHRRSGLKVRLFSQFQYKAKTWDKKRRVIAKAEYSDRGANPRYVLTNLEGRSQRLYDEIYCARGEMENRIKEQQLGLFSDRTSCHAWWANQFRLLLLGELPSCSPSKQPPKPNPRVCSLSVSTQTSMSQCSDRRMHREPMWLIPVSIICGWRAAGR